MRQFFNRRWFLLSLAIIFALGMAFSSQLQPLAEAAALRYSIVATVLFLMALPVEASAMWQSLRKPWAPLLAIVINFAFLPLVAWGLSFGLNDALAAGMLVAATTPCTLASASVWTRRAGGDDSVAIMVTIVTNAICFLVTPAWLVLMMGKSLTIHPLDMIEKLGLIVVLPMAVAQLLRVAKPVGIWATKNKIPLGVIAQCGILCMIFVGSIRTGQRLLSDDSKNSIAVFDYAVMTVFVLGLHTLMLFFGLFLARCVGMARKDQIAVGIAGSQKTLMVGLQNAIELHITIIPMVIFHVGQLFIDTFVADLLRHRGGKGNNANGTAIQT